MLLEINQVYGGYGNGDIVKGISCSADLGDVLCLVGPNGCGKTTVAFRAKCKIFSHHLQKPILKTEKGRFKGL